MTWDCFSLSGFGPLEHIMSKMDCFSIDILEDSMLPFAGENMPSLDNYSKHTSKHKKTQFHDQTYRYSNDLHSAQITIKNINV